ncbi:MAG: hypothetical protein DA446_09345 [Bacteroidetes bacterium]|jgi:hypothetical protein|nr:MAG: hypothetical protein DA443_05675 [Bacteroidota bacterium]PTM17945.1 MAG: hypothetical protein DA446_09345 [Bacteroidota bacterium]
MSNQVNINPDEYSEILRQAVAVFTRYESILHNLLLLQKVEDDQAVEFYANEVFKKDVSQT